MGCYMINKRQYNILSFYLTRTLFLGGGFSLLLKLTRNDFLIASVLGMLLGYFLLYLFFKKNNISKFMECIVAIVILVMAMLSNTSLTSNYLLKTTPTLPILLIFIVSLLYASKKEFKVIGRVAEIFIFISFLEITFALLNLVGIVNVSNMLPLFTTNTINIIKGIIVFTGCSLLPNILLIRYKNDLKFSDIHYGYLIGSLLMIVVLFFVITIYGSKLSSMVIFPEFLILKKIDIMGYLSNIENVLVTEWLFNILMSSWFCFKVLRDNMNRGFFYLIVFILIVVSELVFNRSYVNILFIKQYFYYIAFLVSLLTLVIKKRKS